MTPFVKKQLAYLRGKRHYNLKMAKLFLEEGDYTTMHIFSTIAEQDQIKLDEFEKFYP